MCAKLAYAGAGVCLRRNDRLDAVASVCTTYRGERETAKPQVRQLNICPVSSVGRASPW